MHVPQIEMSPNGPGMSRIAIGFWRLMEWKFTPSEIVKLVEQSLELGITTTDHASIYGGYRCEKEFGKALQLAPGLRDKIQIVTKCGIETRCEAKPQNALGHYDTRTAVIIETAERSLQNFGIDCIDLLLVHRPDPLMDADAVAEAFMHLRQEGKVLHFGVSNFTPWQFNLLQSRLDFPLVTNQVEISPSNLRLCTMEPSTNANNFALCHRRGLRLPAALSLLVRVNRQFAYGTNAIKSLKKLVRMVSIRLLWHGYSSILHEFNRF